MTSRGKFITLEGGEGVGKSTNLRFIQDYLTAHGIELVVTREPGGTDLGEAIRQLLLDVDNHGMHADTELLLVFAARAEHVHRKILPALSQGHWVLSDRFTDASFAYQGGGRGMGAERVDALARFVLEDFQPDLTLLLDADVDVGMSRVAQRGEKDRFENEQTVFFDAVRHAYAERAEDHPTRIKRVNAMQPLPAVQAEIQSLLDALLHDDGR